MANRQPLRTGLEFVLLVFAAVGVGTLFTALAFETVADASSGFGLTSARVTGFAGSSTPLAAVIGVALGWALADRRTAVLAAGAGTVLGYLLLVLATAVVLVAIDQLQSLSLVLDALRNAADFLVVQALGAGLVAAIAAVAGHRLAAVRPDGPARR